jgi:DNA polymerase-1
MSKSVLLLIDGNAIVHRSFHALPPLTAPDGRLVNAVYGFFSTLLSAFKQLEPTYCIVAFDVSGPTFRDELFDAYKAKRAKAPQTLYDQIPLIKEILSIFEIPSCGISGFEADDIIGTLAEQSKKNSQINHTYIVTGDQDSYQLIDDKVSVFTMRTGLKDTIVMDRQAVIDKFGFGPEHIVNYKALRGDPSDNIPGIAGIGDISAKNLIKDYGDIENIFKNIGSLSPTLQNKIKDHQDDGHLSKKLATINREVPTVLDLDKAKLHDFDQARLEKAFTRLGMKSLIKRLPQSTIKVTTHIQETLL